MAPRPTENSTVQSNAVPHPGSIAVHTATNKVANSMVSQETSSNDPPHTPSSNVVAEGIAGTNDNNGVQPVKVEIIGSNKSNPASKIKRPKAPHKSSPNRSIVRRSILRIVIDQDTRMNYAPHS